jgi:hypothetical protein
MSTAAYILSVIHVKTKQGATLELADNQSWQVGREDGSTRLDKWSIGFDPALSRDHLQIRRVGATLEIQATKNRHPILFEGTPKTEFSLVPGQSFSTARLKFQFEEQVADESIVSELELLCLTAAFAILFNAGVGFGGIFLFLNSRAGAGLKAALEEVESAVMQRGELLSKALSRHPGIFQESYIGMIEVGEAGNLGAALERLYRQLLAELQEKDEMQISCVPGPISAACINLAELLEAGAPEGRAFRMAAKATNRAELKQALLEISEQLAAGQPFGDCQFSGEIPPLLVSLMVTYHSLGKLPLGFREFAQLLSLPPTQLRATGEL